MALIEKTGVKDIYVEIASHFSDKRQNQWDWITRFIADANKSINDINVLDIGCGNGRNMEGFNAAIASVYGIDNCDPFVKMCSGKGLNVIHADMSSIPFPDNNFHYFLSIASFHHLSTRERRIKTLKEIHRIAKKGAEMLISVWSLKQPVNTSQSKKIKSYGDNLVQWNKDGKIYDRYYYIFKVDEITKLFNETGWDIISHTWEYGNEVFVLKKLN
jgi:ubiquinone/menaquinone biosynthesis C-methylase UbiE